MDAEKPLLETHDVQLEVRHPAVTQGTEEDKDEEEEEEEEDGVPYDRGWAWMVVLGQLPVSYTHLTLPTSSYV